MKRFDHTTIAGTAIIAMCISIMPSAPLMAEGVDDSQLVVVTEDVAFGPDGCDAISIFDLRNPSPLFRGAPRISPGRLAATSDFETVLAVNSNIVGTDSFLYLLRRDDLDRTDWRSEAAILGANFHLNGGIAIGPDDDTLLVTTTPHFPNYIARPGPASVETYLLSEVSGNRIGPSHGVFVLDSPAAEILFDDTGSLAHILTVAGSVRTIDTSLMIDVAAPIEGPLPTVSGFPPGRAPAEYFHASLSPDGRTMIANRWHGRGVTAFNLKDRTATTIDLPAAMVGGVAFNHAESNHGLLAVHEDVQVVVYRFDPPGTLTELSQLRIARPVIPNRGAAEPFGPLASIAWSGDGTHLIAATDMGRAEFQVLSVTEEGGLLTAERFLTACPLSDGNRNLANDILTSNRLRPPTSTPSPTPSPTATSPATNTAVPTASPSNPPTSIPSPTATILPPPSPTPTASPPPRPLYLPLALRERCRPDEQRLDIALVLDASTSMLEPTAAGRTKLEAATEAARILLDQLRLDKGDQAALIAFNADVTTLQTLTSVRADLDGALMRIAVAQQTRIDLGVQAAADEFGSARHRPSHTPVMVVLTDGRANPVPADVAVANAAAAKAAGITVYTVGVGADLDLEALRAMASSPAHVFLAPDAEQLADVYRAIAVALPCAGRYWPGGGTGP